MAFGEAYSTPFGYRPKSAGLKRTTTAPQRALARPPAPGAAHAAAAATAAAATDLNRFGQQRLRMQWLTSHAWYTSSGCTRRKKLQTTPATPIDGSITSTAQMARMAASTGPSLAAEKSRSKIMKANAQNKNTLMKLSKRSYEVPSCVRAMSWTTRAVRKRPAQNRSAHAILNFTGCFLAAFSTLDRSWSVRTPSPSLPFNKAGLKQQRSTTHSNIVLKQRQGKHAQQISPSSLTRQHLSAHVESSSGDEVRFRQQAHEQQPLGPFSSTWAELSSSGAASSVPGSASLANDRSPTPLAAGSRSASAGSGTPASTSVPAPGCPSPASATAGSGSSVAAPCPAREVIRPSAVELHRHSAEAAMMPSAKTPREMYRLSSAPS
mmetsp:Transcript_31730/g.80146  ORF Transcript_31730/g.80146 Transcript_31730/m.80146 type:complete len:379 (+) Transcript_31730:104-1240(+)